LIDPLNDIYSSNFGTTDFILIINIFLTIIDTTHFF